MNKSQLLQEFDKKVKEVQDLTNELLGQRENGDSRIVEFGMKTITDDEIYTIPDWGNIRKFVEGAFKEIEEEESEKHRNAGCKCGDCGYIRRMKGQNDKE